MYEMQYEKYLLMISGHKNPYSCKNISNHKYVRLIWVFL